MSQVQKTGLLPLNINLAGMILSLVVFLSIPLSAQKIEHRPGDFLVQVNEGINIDEVAKNHAEFQGRATQLNVERLISPHLNIYLMTFDYGNIHEREFLKELRNDPDVINAQLNHKLELRQDTEPNDPEFYQQWYLHNTGQGNGTPGVDISALDAWEITTGGVTAHGDTIVVAVIDDGINLDHPDLKDHIWINRHEIANTGEDDDGNGYIDDIYGWNTFDNTGNVSGGFLGGHGTSVSGMIGAMTNNAEGIAGINWHVKIMTIVGGNGFESNAIESYTYALTQRQIYNETNGERGAFVVATNSSWGRDGLQPEAAPLWCAFYDLMGKHGILSTGATTNRNNDVDVVGDMPTACGSQFLISVTASNDRDLRANTGFGKNTIELAAPGANVRTTGNNGGYVTTSGTSFAAPLVAGVIALTYSLECEGFMNIAKSDPERAALMVRQSILDGVDRIESLRDATVTGGRLNAAQSLNNLIDACQTCPPPGSINRDTLTPTSVTYSWIPVMGTEQTNVRYRVNTNDWIVLEDVESPFQIELELCTQYELEIQAICDMDESPWTPFDSVQTEGCCEPPSEFDLEFFGNNVTISWNEIIPAFEYTVRFREFGDDFWSITDLWIPNEITFSDLKPCHFYEFQVQSRCNTGFTAFSEVITFQTPDCFSCTELDYCESAGEDADFDWIDTAQIGDLVLDVGRGDGYEDRTGDGLAGVLNLGDTLPIRLVPGHVGGPFPAYFRIWIDFDRNGSFDTIPFFEGSDLIFDPGKSVSEALDTILILPDDLDIQTGNARLRISMKYMENTDSIPPIDPCETFEFGQVYDFCVFLYRPFVMCPEVTEVRAEDKTPGSFTAVWDKLDYGLAYNLRYRALGSDEWEDEVAVPDTFYVINDLSPCSPYEVQVRSICPFDTSNYSVSYILFTECPNNVEEVVPESGISVLAYPNPFVSELSIEIQTGNQVGGNFDLRIWNMQGQLTGTKRINLGSNQTSHIHLNQMRTYPPGMYLIEITDGTRRKVTRVVKQ